MDCIGIYTYLNMHNILESKFILQAYITILTNMYNFNKITCFKMNRKENGNKKRIEN